MSSIKIKGKIKMQNTKNSTLFNSHIIECNEENDKSKIYDLMKNGYIEMGEINLQLATDNGSELVDINNYETWLCGV